MAGDTISHLPYSKARLLPRSYTSEKPLALLCMLWGRCDQSTLTGMSLNYNGRDEKWNERGPLICNWNRDMCVSGFSVTRDRYVINLHYFSVTDSPAGMWRGVVPCERDRILHTITMTTAASPGSGSLVTSWTPRSSGILQSSSGEPLVWLTPRRRRRAARTTLDVAVATAWNSPEMTACRCRDGGVDLADQRIASVAATRRGPLLIDH